MRANLTLDFGTRLTQDEQITLLSEVQRRGCELEDVIVEALRLRRQHQPQPPAGLLSAPDVEAAQAA